MDAAKLKQQVTTLKLKARAARSEGKRDAARSFRRGARRAKRRLQVLAKRAQATAKKEADA